MGKGRSIWQAVKKNLSPTGLILAYHNIGQRKHDPYELTVEDHLFEEHLELLSTTCTIVPLKKILDAVNSKVRNPVAISFDDGYLNNFTTAIPMLEKYSAPATFFISTDYISSSNCFWWDLLQRLLFQETLPSSIHIKSNIENLTIDLSGEEYITPETNIRNLQWTYIAHQPTKRAKAFAEIARLIMNTSRPEIVTAQLEKMLGEKIVSPTMGPEQLKIINEHPLFCIGAHTITHRPLNVLNKESQLQEILGSIETIHKITGKRTSLFAYPHGLYNHETLQIARDCGITMAFTTSAEFVNNQTNLLKIPRVNVRNVGTRSLQTYLQTVFG